MKKSIIWVFIMSSGGLLAQFDAYLSDQSSNINPALAGSKGINYFNTNGSVGYDDYQSLRNFAFLYETKIEKWNASLALKSDFFQASYIWLYPDVYFRFRVAGGSVRFAKHFLLKNDATLSAGIDISFANYYRTFFGSKSLGYGDIGAVYQKNKFTAGLSTLSLTGAFQKNGFAPTLTLFVSNQFVLGEKWTLEPSTKIYLSNFKYILFPSVNLKFEYKEKVHFGLYSQRDYGQSVGLFIGYSFNERFKIATNYSPSLSMIGKGSNISRTQSLGLQLNYRMGKKAKKLEE
jgi:hypothetical protein